MTGVVEGADVLVGASVGVSVFVGNGVSVFVGNGVSVGVNIEVSVGKGVEVSVSVGAAVDGIAVSVSVIVTVGVKLAAGKKRLGIISGESIIALLVKLKIQMNETKTPIPIL